MEKKIKSLFLSCGADVCGIGAVSRFENAPAGFSPGDLDKNCKSVIVLGKSLPKGLLSDESKLIYGHFNEMLCGEADKIAMDAAVQMEKKFHCRAMPVPSDGPYDYWESETMTGKGVLSLKHAAVLCGLGFLGRNTMLIHPEYGNLLTLGAVLSDLELASDPLRREECPESCGKCQKSCPVQAIGNGVVDQKKCRMNAYGKTSRGFDRVFCNQCRVVCPMRFGK
ncbi:MAG: epoxyqueuosine reductase [Clostridia bacterium]